MWAGLISGLEKGEKMLGLGMWTPWYGGEITIAMRQTEDDQAKEKLEDVPKTR